MYCSYCETDGCDLQPGSAVSDIDRLLYYWDHCTKNYFESGASNRFIRSKRDEELREQEKSSKNNRMSRNKQGNRLILTRKNHKIFYKQE